MDTPIRILLADDHTPTRMALRAELEDEGFLICAEAEDATGALAAARRERPDLCLLDVDMPGDGIDAAAAIVALVPGTAVVMLTVSSDETDVLRALRAGVAGYLLKDMNMAGLADVLRKVLAGELALPRSLHRGLVEAFRRS
jgi:two-component system, NarL family, nitrate/nitrite response regulator NarL